MSGFRARFTSTIGPVVRKIWPKYGEPRPVLTAVVQHFLGEKIALRAASLTYISIFSLVPLATLALQLLATFHQNELRDRVHAFITDLLTPGVRNDSIALLDKVLQSAAAKSVSWVSIVALLVAGGSLLKNLDASLNELWAVQEKRPWWLRIVLYGLAMTAGPLLLAVSLASSSGARRFLTYVGAPKMWMTGGVFLAPIVGLFLLYKFAPKAKIEWRAALWGSAAAGVTWGVAKIAYASFAARIFRYNILYGSLGAIPLFLAWLYVSWLIVLSGARLAYAIQHAGYRDRWPLYELHRHGPQLLAASLAKEFARAWTQSRPVMLAALAEQVGGPLDLVRSAVAAFEQAGLVTLQEGGYVASRAPSSITFQEACAALRSAAQARRPRLFLRTPPELGIAESALEAAEKAEKTELSAITWADLDGQVPPSFDHLPRQAPTAVRNP